MNDPIEQPEELEIHDVIAQRLVAQVTSETDSDQPSVEEPSVKETRKPSRVPTGQNPSKPEFIKVEKNLAGLGFFSPSSKRVRTEKAKTITFVKVVDDKRIEAKATIAPLALLGLPITADQDKYLALQKIITDLQQEQGKVTNPIPFVSADLLRLVGQRKNGQRYKEIEEWLKVMVSTSIFSEGTVYFAGQKRWVKDYFHVFDRAVSIGKELPDGTIADKNYVWLSDWQLENINSNHQLPIDIEAYRQLKNHIAKALVPLLQIWLYASRDDGSFSKRYDELCEILHVHRYRQRSRIKEQFGPSLDELMSQGYLAEWKVEPTSDRKAYKIVLRHGEKFHRDRRKRLGETSAPEPKIESAPVEPSVAPPAKQGSVDPALLEALTKRGVSERQARHVLAGVSSEQPIQDQLEWADHVVAQGGDQIANPAGFYVSVIRDRVMPPAGFETSSTRRLKEETAKAESEGRAAEARLGMAYEEYVQRETDDEISRLAPTDYEARLALKVEALTTAHATFAVWGIDQRRRIAQTALTKDIRSEIGYRLFDFTTFCRVQKMVNASLRPPPRPQNATT